MILLRYLSSTQFSRSQYSSVLLFLFICTEVGIAICSDRQPHKSRDARSRGPLIRGRHIDVTTYMIVHLIGNFLKFKDDLLCRNGLVHLVELGSEHRSTHWRIENYFSLRIASPPGSALVLVKPVFGRRPTATATAPHQDRTDRG